MRVSDDLQEWNYGAYEGLAIADIRKMRQEKGQDAAWNIWRDGCEGGEYVTMFSMDDGCVVKAILLKAFPLTHLYHPDHPHRSRADWTV